MTYAKLRWRNSQFLAAKFTIFPTLFDIEVIANENIVKATQTKPFDDSGSGIDFPVEISWQTSGTYAGFAKHKQIAHLHS